MHLVIDDVERRRRLLRLAESLAQLAGHAEGGPAPQPRADAVRALLDAAGAVAGGAAALLRRAADGTYGEVRTLEERPLPGGRAALDGPPLRFENAPAGELAIAVPGPGARAELVLAVRCADHRPDELERAALELVASSFALAARNAVLAAEGERRRRELREARATQAELVARLTRDVRGPVTSIVGFARLLEEDGRFPPDAREALAVVRASGERIGELASDVDLLSRIELAAVEPQWQPVDVGALAAAAGAEVEQRPGMPRIVADPDLLATVLHHLVESGRRPAAPVHARIEDLGEAVAIELSGTGASPAGDAASPTIGGRLAARIVERHGGAYRAGASGAAWWVRLTLPADPRRAERGLAVLLIGPAADELAEQLRALGFAVETAAKASEAGAALRAVDVAVFAAGRGAWAEREQLSPGLRRRVGLVALSSSEQRAGDGWDATVRAPTLAGDLGAAVYAAAAKARSRRTEDGPAPSAN